MSPLKRWPAWTSRRMKIDATNDAATPRMQSVCEAARPIFGPQSPTMIDAMSGANGTIKYRPRTLTASLIVDVPRSSAQPPLRLDVDRAGVAEKEHEDRKADRGLGGGDGQDEEHEHLPRHVAQVAREGDEVQVDGEQHELDRHQHDDDVAAIEEDARHADREQDRSQHEVMRKRRCAQCHVVTPYAIPASRR